MLRAGIFARTFAKMASTYSIGIDGPAGAGKSTIAKLVSKKQNLQYVDTGAMYRSVGLLAHRQNVDTKDENALAEIAKSAEFSFKMDGSLNRVFLNGEDVSTAIREPHVGTLASQVAKIKGVRKELVTKQRAMAEHKGVVMEGRDVCTAFEHALTVMGFLKVLPDVKVKIYLTASPEERAHRRLKELQDNGKEVTFEEVLAEVKDRDHQDMSRAESPLRPAEDSVHVNTDGLSIEQVVDKIGEVVKTKVKS